VELPRDSADADAEANKQGSGIILSSSVFAGSIWLFVVVLLTSIVQ
jgi:hypothetical protein